MVPCPATPVVATCCAASCAVACATGSKKWLVATVVANMKDAFPELEEKMHFVQEVILDEEMSFNRKCVRATTYAHCV